MKSPPDQRHHGRKRSRSPDREDRHDEVGHARSRSPHRRHHRHHHHHHQHRSPPPTKIIPFHRGHLHKNDYSQYRNLFAEYLDVQKGIDISELPDAEVKGRWKSFVGKWNRADLAEGWYDPATKTRIDERFAASSTPPPARASSPIHDLRRSSQLADISREHQSIHRDSPDQSYEDEDDDYGPALPNSSSAPRSGPTIPRLQDLQHRDELLTEDRIASRADQRSEQRRDHDVQRARLDDLAPRADPGTRERQLEKKRDVAAANRSFREAKSPGAAEIGESTLMGDDNDGVDAYRARKNAREKIKNEREIRKEEILRARAAERAERLAEHRQKEEKTMEMLRAMAKQRFG